MKDDASMLSPRMGTEHDTDCDFVGRVEEVTSFDFLGRSAYSGASRPLIPIEGGHRFRRKPATHSEAKRPLIPG